MSDKIRLWIGLAATNHIFDLSENDLCVPNLNPTEPLKKPQKKKKKNGKHARFQGDEKVKVR